MDLVENPSLPYFFAFIEQTYLVCFQLPFKRFLKKETSIIECCKTIMIRFQVH